MTNCHNFVDFAAKLQRLCRICKKNVIFMHGWRNFRTFVSKYNADMAMNSRELELILINISGQDHPGVTSAQPCFGPDQFGCLRKHHEGVAF